MSGVNLPSFVTSGSAIAPNPGLGVLLSSSPLFEPRRSRETCTDRWRERPDFSVWLGRGVGRPVKLDWPAWLDWPDAARAAAAGLGASDLVCRLIDSRAALAAFAAYKKRSRGVREKMREQKRLQVQHNTALTLWRTPVTVCTHVAFHSKGISVQKNSGIIVKIVMVIWYTVSQCSSPLCKTVLNPFRSGELSTKFKGHLFCVLQLKVSCRSRSSGKYLLYLPADRPRPWNF